MSFKQQYVGKQGCRSKNCPAMRTYDQKSLIHSLALPTRDIHEYLVMTKVPPGVETDVWVITVSTSTVNQRMRSPPCIPCEVTPSQLKCGAAIQTVQTVPVCQSGFYRGKMTIYAEDASKRQPEDLVHLDDPYAQ
ncbi:hypothetical protein T265_00779 [Opisthorchis viverrini]|uniref:Uncharacterized protein n=1 Tax=Opisthorchis viverrini TaxID=6198 RepID=A0A075AJF1_OPIVI|nr:hypothetical protein T265_00779 [Opisthorchis viverrini]KER33274.1 hypothetical protein T265_00779 [Opisthorchis viverrini]